MGLTLLSINLGLGNFRSMVQRKQETLKSTRFVDTRVPDIYAATKPGDRSNKFLTKDKKVCTPVFFC